jgi:hypothetical protein
MGILPFELDGTTTFLASGFAELKVKDSVAIAETAIRISTLIFIISLDLKF